MERSTLRTLALTGAALFALLAPSGAHAGEIRSTLESFEYNAGQFEVNQLTVKRDGGLVFHDPTAPVTIEGLTELLFCTQSDEHTVVCDDTITSGPIVVRLGPGDDSFGVDKSEEFYGYDVDGGAGDDVLTGSVNADYLRGGMDDDRLMGEAGDDTLDGGIGNDILDGGSAPEDSEEGDNDTATYETRVSPVHVRIDGEPGDGEQGEKDDVEQTVENLTGGKSNDTLTGSDEDNLIVGGDGDDKLNGQGGNDVLDGRMGFDVASWDGVDGAVTATLPVLPEEVFEPVPLTEEEIAENPDGPTERGPTPEEVRERQAELDEVDPEDSEDNDGTAREADRVLQNVESLEGGEKADYLVGNEGWNFLFGGPGKDDLKGGDLNDVLVGGAGADLLDGGRGADAVDYGARSKPVSITTDEQPNDGEEGEGDQVRRTIEILIGGRGDDTITGDGIDQVLRGGDGDDVLDGGHGNDDLDGGSGIDTVSYAARTAPVGVIIDGNANDGQGKEADNVRISVENLVGGESHDVLTGSDGHNIISGGKGDDRLRGGNGADVLDGGDGYGDTADYSDRTSPVNASIGDGANDGERDEGDDVTASIENIEGGAADDVLTGTNRGQRLYGHGGNDRLNGMKGNDLLVGGQGDDTLDGGRDYDTVVGGIGIDTALVDANDTVGPDVERQDRVDSGPTGQGQAPPYQDPPSEQGRTQPSGNQPPPPPLDDPGAVRRARPELLAL